METRKMREIIITAAVVGASPRYIDPQSSKYLPYSFVQTVPHLKAALVSSQCWTHVENGSLVMTSATNNSEFIRNRKISGKQDEVVPTQNAIEKDITLSRHYPETSPNRVLPREWFSKLTSKKLTNQLILHLTSQGWTSDANCNLVWKHEGSIECYISPQHVQMLSSVDAKLINGLIALGWHLAGPGYVLSTSGGSPWVPITPQRIIEESAAAISEGATIVHLHTRKLTNQSSWELPWSTKPLVLGSQVNQIVTEDYDIIVPELRDSEPLAILNLSTSARGGGDSESSIRREHLKEYRVDRAPEMCSMSPGEVLFSGGQGYQNSPKFLEQQLAHAQRCNIRPEIEVFNRTILRETLGPFKPRLMSCGLPSLLMLVAGVDQQRRILHGMLEDDSLIPAARRQEVFSLLHVGTSVAKSQALEITVAELSPIVNEIRRSLPDAKISILLPGPMQQLLAKVAIMLELDGVRIGLEDGLSVSDPLVSGGVRKGSSAEQVRNLREELKSLGCHVLSMKDTRRVLAMPHSAESLFIAAMSAASHISSSNTTSDNPMNEMAEALGGLQPAFQRREKWLLEQLTNQHWDDPTKASSVVRELISKAGLYVRYFVEERDRYPKEGAAKFRKIYDIQALNYVYEILEEAGQDSAAVQDMLKSLATSCGTTPNAFLTPPDQRKSRNLRFLEYLVSLSCSFNADKSGVLHTTMRERPGYNDFLAAMFKAIEWEYRQLRLLSEAEPKSDGILGLQIGQKESYIGHESLREHIVRNDWIILPSTPTTAYSEGKRLSQGLGAVFLSHLKRMLPSHIDNIRVLGLVHPGLNEKGEEVSEASFLHNRFLLGTDRHTSIVGYSSRLLYENILLPRLVKHPELLLYNSKGMIEREAGLPLYADRTAAERIDNRAIGELTPLRFLAHSSGIATMQQMDNAMRDDMKVLGYSNIEQELIFTRNIVVSFASAADINLDVCGTPTVDITAFNDIRSMAGTTTPDYLVEEEFWRRQSIASRDAKYRYDESKWKVIRGPAGKMVLRRIGVYLRSDPARWHDGHSIGRYLEGAPEDLCMLIARLHLENQAPRFDLIINEFANAEDTL